MRLRRFFILLPAGGHNTLPSSRAIFVGASREIERERGTRDQLALILISTGAGVGGSGVRRGGVGGDVEMGVGEEEEEKEKKAATAASLRGRNARASGPFTRTRARSLDAYKTRDVVARRNAVIIYNNQGIRKANKRADGASVRRCERAALIIFQDQTWQCVN